MKQSTEMTDAVKLLKLIQSRRSIRQFESRPVPRPVLERLLEAARWGPSAHNRQPWRFTVLTQADDKQHLAETMAAQLEADLRADGVDEDAIRLDTTRSKRRLTDAAALIVVCMTMIDMDTYPDEQRQHFELLMAVQSVAMAAQNLLLQAHAEELGAVWMCAPLFCQPVVREALSLPADYQPQGIIAVGYPTQERTKTRHPLESRVTWK